MLTNLGAPTDRLMNSDTVIKFLAMAFISQYLPHAFLASICLNVFCILWLIRLEYKQRKIVRGKTGKDLESSIMEVYRNADENEKFRIDMENYLLNVEKRLSRSLQSVETVKFDAFQGTGSGNQSFSTVYINERGDGVIISVLTARDRTSFFSKALKNFKSMQVLSPEENHALEKAKQKLSE